MRTIALSADEHLIEAARARAQAESTTLDEQFRLWLEGYIQQAAAPAPSRSTPPTRRFGALAGRARVDARFFEPLPEAELSAWEQ